MLVYCSDLWNRGRRKVCKVIYNSNFNLDRIYGIFRILFCLSTFPEESLKTKSLREKESGIGVVVNYYNGGRWHFVTLWGGSSLPLTLARC